jgi:ABC-type uncharacterized transport system substrate-binding protein
MRLTLKKTPLLFVICLAALAGVWWFWPPANPKIGAPLKTEVPHVQTEPRPRILFVNSYHRGYKWSDQIEASLLKELNVRLTPDGELDTSHSPYDLHLFYMDTKRHASAAFKEEAALAAKNLIDTWKPDVVVTADDNAAKYLIVPHFKGSEIPFVFCGVNWETGPYGFPTRNITGMVEVSLVPQQIEMLARFAKGHRIGMLGADVETNRKHADNLRRHDPDLTDYLVDSFDEWKAAYLRLQDEVDMAFVAYSEGVAGWDPEKARVFATTHARIPSGSWDDWRLPLVLITVAKDPTEQGEWAARTAKRILAGTPAADIPQTENKRAKLSLNMAMAARLGIVFPAEWIQQAELYQQEPQRILFVNSYHVGYGWSDKIEGSFLSALDVLPEDATARTAENNQYSIRFIRMDSKNRPGEARLRKVAETIKAAIAEWQPDLIVLSDDNAVKYLFDHLKGLNDLPVLFCGVNWDATIYGLPADNIRGMVEVDPMDQLAKFLKTYARGTRIGFLGVDRMTTHKEIEAYRTKLGIEFAAVHEVKTFDDWKDAFARLQDQVDMIVLSTVSGIEDWREAEAIAIVEKTIQVPTGTTLSTLAPIFVAGIVRVAEEQGWWVGQAARAILDGEKTIGEIEMTTNQNNRLLLNPRLASKLGITFPSELIKEATLITAQPESTPGDRQ